MKLSEPLNAWGGLNPDTGIIIHHSHPQRGECLAGRVLVMQESRGSGTNAQVFAQAWANGCGPRAVVLAEPDYVLCVGAVVAAELYQIAPPVVVVEPNHYAALKDGQKVSVYASDLDATLTMADAPSGESVGFGSVT
ncbi:hypothetical protein AU194_20805 [Mycobacterium sp. GA-2829]|nr:hypothetical protein AU194_20805 [Mycobacterium sp. GA-2829]